MTNAPTSARPIHFADRCGPRSFDMDPPPSPSARKDSRSLPPKGRDFNWNGHLSLTLVEGEVT